MATGNREVGKTPDVKFSVKSEREIKYNFTINDSDTSFNVWVFSSHHAVLQYQLDVL